MNIAIDVFGGDNAPLAVLQGCAMAREEYQDIHIILTGEREKIKKAARAATIDLADFEICQAPSVILPEEDPFEIRRSRADSSMAVGLSLLAQGKADAFISGGSTAALTVGASLIVKRIRGIKRAALAPVLPSEKGPFMLIDAGANLDCRSDMLLQFAIMGSIYAERVLGIEQPRVGLANVGAEPNKGTGELQEAFGLIQKSKYCHFVGNIEARDLPMGVCDVLVSDGISGNMILKTMEGMGSFFVDSLKEMFMSNRKGKIAAALLLDSIKELKKKMDYTEYGGGVLMGVSRPVIKAHGSSNAKAFKNAIRQARLCVKNRVIKEIIESIGGIHSKNE